MSVAGGRIWVGQPNGVTSLDLNLESLSKKPDDSVRVLSGVREITPLNDQRVVVLGDSTATVLVDPSTSTPSIDTPLNSDDAQTIVIVNDLAWIASWTSKYPPVSTVISFTKLLTSN